MFKWIIGIILFIGIVLWASWAIVDWGFNTDIRNAEKACAELGAKPHYTYRTHYICVTSDGRVVG